MKAFNDLTERGQVCRLRALARRALESYGLREAVMTYVGETENTSFRVDAPDEPHYAPALDNEPGPYVPGRYLLRVHLPGNHTPVAILRSLSG